MPPSDLHAKFTELAPVYDTQRFEDSAKRFHWEHDVALIRRALGHVTDRRLLVDVACGTAQFTTAVADLFDRTIGIDLTEAMLRRGREKSRELPIRFVRGSAMELPFRLGAADAVLSTRFLHLFPRERHRSILEGMLAVVRPGGILVVEHDGPFLTQVRNVWRRARRKPRLPQLGYHRNEHPTGATRLAVYGASAPMLPALSHAAPRLARALARLCIRAPFRWTAKFVVVVYRKH